MMRRAFETRRNHLVERMNRIPDVSCLKPEGAFYVMMNIRKLIGRTIHGVTIQDGDDFADAFLKHGLVALVPGSGFGSPGHVRIACCVQTEMIERALPKFRALAESYR